MSSVMRLSRPLVPLLRRRLRGSRWLQVAMLIGRWLAAETLVRAAHLPVPAGIIGMLVLLALLGRQWIAPQTVSRGAGWLLAEMLLFFVPAAMIVIQNPQLFGTLGLKLLLVIVVGTVLVMAATALTIDLLFRWKQRRESR